MAKLQITEGRVTCPRLGDIGVERCLGCPELRGVSRNRRGDQLLCRGRSGAEERARSVIYY